MGVAVAKGDITGVALAAIVAVAVAVGIGVAVSAEVESFFEQPARASKLASRVGNITFIPHLRDDRLLEHDALVTYV